MFLDQSYFTGPLTIAQLGQKEVVDKLKDFINLWEPVIMEAALGYDFYQAFLNELDVGSDETPEQRWLDLAQGKAFVNIQGIKKRWVGFAGIQTLPSGQKPVSALAGFIYYEFMKDLASQNTGIGLVKSEGENSRPANVVRKPVDAFNDAAIHINVLWEFFQADQNLTVKIYPEFDPIQVVGYECLLGCNYRGNGLYSFKIKNTFGI